MFIKGTCHLSFILQAMSLCQQLLRFCDPTTSGRFAELHSKTPETTCISPGNLFLRTDVKFTV